MSRVRSRAQPWIVGRIRQIHLYLPSSCLVIGVRVDVGVVLSRGLWKADSRARLDGLLMSYRRIQATLHVCTRMQTCITAFG
jgi:hypothetical protein